jgi:secreted trypsin-like serine protease
VPITPELVLTAAHCIQQFRKYWPEDALVVKNNTEEARTIRVKRWYIHPHFQQTPTPHQLDIDVALLVLDGSLQSKKERMEDLPVSIHKQTQSLWMKGYSPIRLKTDSARAILSSRHSWNQLSFERELVQEGKLQLRTQDSQSAPCAGDSGAPLWSFENNSRELKAVVVQGNCAGGKANAISIRSMSEWIQNTLNQLNEYRSAAQELWKIYPKRLFAADHNSPLGRE